VFAVALVAIMLEGCQASRHPIGFWRAQPSFLHQYALPFPEVDAVFNSCMSTDVPRTMKCHGHGECLPWSQTVPIVPVDYNHTEAQQLLFCKCDTLWADPECATPRKSTRTTFMLSLFFGWLGLDQFYLGYPLRGALKLLTFGGCGFWYLFDLVAVMAGPVYSSNSFRTAEDIPHWVTCWAVLASLLLVAFWIGVRSVLQNRLLREQEALRIKVEQTMSNKDLGAHTAAEIIWNEDDELTRMRWAAAVGEA